MFKTKLKTVDSVLSAFSKALGELHGVQEAQLDLADEKRANVVALEQEARNQEAEAKKHELEASRANAAIIRFEDFFNQLPKSAF